MSVTLSLIPLSIAVGMSLGSSAIAAVTASTKGSDCAIEPIGTIFNDSGLLLNTLSEHGLQVEKLSENEFTVSTESGTLRYFRTDETQPFFLEASRIRNMEELLTSLDELENEYGRNVQAFTYNRVMTSLEEHGMSVMSEEILEDDTIMLTLQV